MNAIVRRFRIPAVEFMNPVSVQTAFQPALVSPMPAEVVARPAPPPVRPLTVDHLRQLLTLQDMVWDELRPGFLRRKHESELRGYLEGAGGSAYGIIESNALIAASLLRVPDGIHRNEGSAFPLVPEEDWPLFAGTFENTMVRTEARGRGCHRALSRARLFHVGATELKWICADVHLENSVAWANLLAGGMAIVGIRWDQRYPMLALLGSLDAARLASDFNDQRFVRARHAAEHQNALQEGYIGIRVNAHGTVVYQRLAAEAAARMRLPRKP